MPFMVSPDGVRLHYEVEGEGPPLILHVGAGADANLWREAGYVEPLSQSFSCVLFDHRGHGRSDHPSTVEANHIDRYVDDLAALIAHLGSSRVVFFGWSNVFAIGMKAEQEHPDKFDAIVLFGGVGRAASPEQIATATAERLVVMREKGWWFLLDAMQEAEKLPVPRWFLDRVAATDVGPWFAYTEARPLWNWRVWDAAAQVRSPALLLAGELEDPDDVLSELAAAMPDAHRVRVPDREHINAFLDSEFVVPKVLEFLRARTPQATG